MVLVLSIKDGLYKIEKSIFRPNYVRYEKMLRSKIVYLKKIYKFGFDYFLEKRTVFILFKKTLLKIKSCGFRPNNARYEKMLSSKIVHLKEIYNFNFDHFLIKHTVFVLIGKNVIKNQKFNFPGKLYDMRNKCYVIKLFISKRSTNFICRSFCAFFDKMHSFYFKQKKMLRNKIVRFKKM